MWTVHLLSGIVTILLQIETNPLKCVFCLLSSGLYESKLGYWASTSNLIARVFEWDNPRKGRLSWRHRGLANLKTLPNEFVITFRPFSCFPRQKENCFQNRRSGKLYILIRMIKATTTHWKPTSHAENMCWNTMQNVLTQQIQINKHLLHIEVIFQTIAHVM